MATKKKKRKPAKPKHGGSREGAGRKSIGDMVGFSANFSREQVDELDAWAGHVGVTRSELLRDIVGQWLAANGKSRENAKDS